MIPTLRRHDQKFQVIPGYIESSRPAWTTGRPYASTTSDSGVPALLLSCVALGRSFPSLILAPRLLEDKFLAKTVPLITVSGDL